MNSAPESSADKNLCRFCGRTTTSSQTQFEKLLRNKQICKQFGEYFGIKLKKEAELPSLICAKCNALLPKYLKFHRQCVKNYHHLKSINSVAVKKEKIEVVEQVSFDTSIADDNDEDPDEVLDKLELKFNFQPKNEIVTGDVAAETVKEPVKPELKKSISKKRQCNVCGAIVINLKCHMRMHQADMVMVCHFCARKITARINMLKHLKIHLNIRDHKCHVCPKDFIDSSSLKLHMTTHSAERNHKCDKCESKFKDRTSLRSHKMHVHEKTPKYVCEIENCDVKFYTPYFLRKHMTNVHVAKQKCSFCPKILKNPKSLEKHQLIHTQPPKFICDICTKICHNADKLGRHKKCHDNPKGRKHQESMRKLQQQIINYS